jgi:hypothetical protein
MVDMSRREVLKSWKEIAAYLGVAVRTAQRWHRERGLPVKKPGATRSSTVLGLPDEIEGWLHEPTSTPAKLEAERPELADIVATDLLWHRHSRPVRLESEVQALVDLGRSMANQDGRAILVKISTYILELCKAESSGFSLLEAGENRKEIFRWTATRGAMKRFEGGTTPADYSPCGVCLERNAPQLFVHPERFYTYLRPISPIAELLLVPMYEGHAWIGTIWVICHKKRRRLDRADARLLIDFGSVASAAILRNGVKRI